MLHKTNRIALAKTLAKTLAVAAVVAMTAPAASALSASYYSPTSKLAHDKWVKVKITDRGMYEITYDELRAWGFANPEKVNVYGCGGTALATEAFTTAVPDDVHLTYTLHEGNKIYFYGSGDVNPMVFSNKYASVLRNYYSTDTYYLLSDRQVNASEMPKTADFNADRIALNAHLALEYVEEELQHPSVGGAIFLGRDIPRNGSLEIPFEIKDMGQGNTAWSTASMRVSYAALNTKMTAVSIGLPEAISVDDARVEFTQVPSTSVPYARYRTGGSTTVSFQPVLEDGTYTFHAFHPNGTQQLLAVDAAWMIYPRFSIMSSGTPALEMSYLMVTPENNFEISASPTTHVINTTSIVNIYPHATTYDAETGHVIGSFDHSYNSSLQPTCRLMAFDTSVEQKKVTYAGQVANQNLHGTSSPDMLIITTETLLPAAQQLAEAHRRVDGMDVMVITQDKAFNEFSSGTPDAMGYRRLIKMFYDRDPEKMKYVILYGPSHWDNRGITFPASDRLLCYETTNPTYSAVDTKCFVSDSFFGMVDDRFTSDNMPSAKQGVAVGRIPARNLGEAYGVNKKLIDYMDGQVKSKTFGSTLLVADDGDNNIHMRQAEAIIDSLTAYHPAITAVRAHNGIYEWDNGDAKVLRSVVTSAFNRGVGYVCFIGHNDDEYFGAEKLWSLAAIRNTGYKTLPLAMLSTCDAFGFDLYKNCMTEELLYKDGGGAIGIVAAGRVVYGSSNQDLAAAMAVEYANAKPGDRLGDVWMRARNRAITAYGATNSTQVNTLCYNFCGDPAIAVPAPHYSVEVTAVNGNAVTTGNDAIDIEPLKELRISGRIVDAEGKPVEDFNGTVNAVLFDAPYQVQTMPRHHADTDPVLTLTLDHDVLVSKTVDVVNGTFSAVIVAPVPVHEGSFNRLTLHADSRNGLRADGALNALRLTAPAVTDEAVAGDAPTIEFLAVNTPGTPDGAFVTGNVRIVGAGTVSDLGLNNSSNIGAGSSLIIDGNVHVAGVKELINVDSQNNWTLAVDLSNLADGAHVARLNICDNIGQTASASVSFVLVNSMSDVTLTVDKNTADGEVIVSVDHALADVGSMNLIVEDMFGRPVASYNDVNFPYALDFKNIDPNLPDGYYYIHVQLRGADGLGSSKPVRVAFIK